MFFQTLPQYYINYNGFILHIIMSDNFLLAKLT